MHVVYDGGCGFCIRALRPFRAMDVFGRFQFMDGRDVSRVTREIPALAEADLDGAMYVHVPGEAPYRGFFAFRRLIWAIPFLWPLLPLLYAPLAGTIGPRAYGWVARNRRSLGCRSETCALPDPVAPPRERRG